MIFDHSASALAGDADEVELTLSNVQMDELRIDSLNEEGYETINLVSTGSDANSLNTLTDEDIQTLNISGDQNLTIAGENGAIGSLTTVDATALEANLDFRISQGIINSAPDGTSNGDIAFTIKSGAGDDIIRVSDSIHSNDTVEMGDGEDTLVIEAIEHSLNYTRENTNISGVETVELLNSDPDSAIIGILADEVDGDQNFILRNNTDAAGNNTTYNVMNLSEVEAQQITIEHSGDKNTNPLPSSNALSDNIVNLDVEDGVSEVAITIGEGVNIDERFNFQLYTDSNIEINSNDGSLFEDEPHGYNDSKNSEIKENEFEIVNSIKSLTINDDDSESNTIQLLAKNVDKDTNVKLDNGSLYTDTITVTGGQEDKFLNLDVIGTQQNNIYGLAVDGGYDRDATYINDLEEYTLIYDSKHVETNPITGTSDIVFDADRIVAENFDASESKADVIARFSTNITDEDGGQNITMGSGDDTVIFDYIGDTSAGLSIADKVDGGEGNDTLVIDGDLTGANNGDVIAISSSEWTYVKNFENIRLVGTNGNDGSNGSYEIKLTNELIANNHDENGLLNIINDNDSLNDINVGSDTIGTAQESAVTIDASGLSSSSHFSYNGEEGATSTNDRIIVSDANINGQNIIDGGASGSTSAGNNDILEVRNGATITTGDLANIKNIGTIELVTTEATDQTFNLNLNDNIVDNMVNSYHVSTDSDLETLNIRTINNIASNGDLTSRAILNLDASTLTDKSNIRLDLDSANHTIKLGDNDNIITLIGSNDDAAPKVLNSTINLGAGNDKLVIEGAMDLSNADLIGVESIEMHSTLIIKESQLDGLKDISFLFSENEHSTLAIIDDDGDGEISISSLLVAEPEDGSDNSNSTEIFDIRGVSQDGSEEADVVFNIKPAIDTQSMKSGTEEGPNFNWKSRKGERGFYPSWNPTLGEIPAGAKGGLPKKVIPPKKSPPGGGKPPGGKQFPKGFRGGGKLSNWGGGGAVSPEIWEKGQRVGRPSGGGNPPTKKRGPPQGGGGGTHPGGDTPHLRERARSRRVLPHK